MTLSAEALEKSRASAVFCLKTMFQRMTSLYGLVVLRSAALI